MGYVRAMSTRDRRRAHRTIARAAVSAALAGCLLVTAADAASAAPTWLDAVPASAVTDCNFLAQSPTTVATAEGTAVAAWVRRDDGCVGATRVEVAVRPPGASFGAPVVLSDPTLEASAPKLAIDPSGTVVAVWSENGFIRYSERPAGGSFSAAQTIAGSGPTAAAPDVAIAGGTVVAGWTNAGAAEVAVKPAGSAAFGAVQTFLTLAEIPADVDVAIDAAGAALMTWQTVGGPLDTLRAAARPAGGGFGQLATVFTTAADLDSIRSPQVEIDSAGRGTLLWAYADSASGRTIVKSASDAGGDFGPVQNASNPAVNSGQLGSIDLALDASGNAIAVWWATTMQASVRPVGGSFGPVIANVSGPNFVITTPSVAFDPSGRAVAAWLSPGGPAFAVQAAILPKGATSFGPVAEHAVPAGAGDLIDGATPIALDDQGNAVGVWRRRLDLSPAPGLQAGYQIESAWLDAVGPELRALSIPSAGGLGEPVAVSVAPVDRLSAIAATTWSFGDGATASGATASHTYTKGGTYQVTVTSTDAVGNATTAARTIELPDKPSPAGLAISKLRVSPSAFRAALKGPSVRAGNLKPWTRVTYSLSLAANVRFSFERPAAGRRSGARCAKPSPRNRGHRSCIRYLPVKGSFTRKRTAGGDRFTFTGRLLGHRLPKGRYRLVARASTAGVSGAAQRASFRILSR